MLNSADLKLWLHGSHSRRDKCLLILATFDAPCAVADLRTRAAEAGLREARNWNFSVVLKSSSPLAIRLPDGWELTQAGKAHLRAMGVSKVSAGAVQVATDLRAFLSKITNPDVREFVEESIKCYEGELYKSAVVMAWLAAIAVLQAFVIQNKLTEFNKEALRINPKLKAAVTTDDIGAMLKESDFLDRLVAISVLGKNVKSDLIQALNLRNGCGHPSSLKISANKAAAHIETLLLNVFHKFAIK